MKKSEDIVDYDLQEILDIAVMNSSYCRNILIKVIKQVQIDAIRETCEECALRAYWGASQNDDGQEPYIHEDNIFVDKKSILSVADKLIKELEDGNKD